jgi:predicted permease
MPQVIEIVLPTFIVIFIGYLLGRFTKLNISPIVDISLYVAVPALVFTSLVNKEIVLLDAARISGSSFIIMFGCMLVAWPVFKALRQRHFGLYVSIGMMNTVNIPFPVIFLAWGAEGLVAATLFYIPNLLLLYTLGIYIMSGKRWQENIREVFRQPVIYASILGLVLSFTRTAVPGLLMNALDFLSMMAIPLVLIILGYNLSRVTLGSVPTTLLAVFLRMGVGLGLGLLIVNVFGITGIFRSVVILDSAMPAAAASSMLASRYRSEADLVSGVVFLSTLVSLGTIPLLLHLLGA